MSVSDDERAWLASFLNLSEADKAKQSNSDLARAFYLGTQTGIVKLDRMASLSGRFLPQGSVDLNALSTDLPTLATGALPTSASTGITGHTENATGDNVRVVGRKGIFSGGTTTLDGNFFGREFYVNGPVEFSWTGRGTDVARFMIYVDGLPISAAPVAPSIATSNGVTYQSQLAWAVNPNKRRRVRIDGCRIAAIGAFRTTLNVTISKAPPKPLYSSLSASFSAGWTTGNNTTALQGIDYVLAQLLGADVQIAGQEGRGFVQAAGSPSLVYGDSAVIDRLLERTPELITVWGSGNDLGVGTLAAYRTAVAACLSTIATRAPGVPIVVFGIPPRNATDTLTADMASRNNILREEANASPAVIAFIDMIGVPTDAVPAAWSSGTSYGPGDLCTYLGSVWQIASHVVGAASNIVPGTSERWVLKTWSMFGTGRVGTTASDGSRDVLLSSDAIHPEVAGLREFAQRAADELRAVLSS